MLTRTCKMNESCTSSIDSFVGAAPAVFLLRDTMTDLKITGSSTKITPSIVSEYQKNIQSSLLRIYSSSCIEKKARKNTADRLWYFCTAWMLLELAYVVEKFVLNKSSRGAKFENWKFQNPIPRRFLSTRPPMSHHPPSPMWFFEFFTSDS